MNNNKCGNGCTYFLLSLPVPSRFVFSGRSPPQHVVFVSRKEMNGSFEYTQAHKQTPTDRYIYTTEDVCRFEFFAFALLVKRKE